jgi:hypothetical protein
MTWPCISNSGEEKAGSLGKEAAYRKMWQWEWIKLEGLVYWWQENEWQVGTEENVQARVEGANSVAWEWGWRVRSRKAVRTGYRRALEVGGIGEFLCGFCGKRWYNVMPWDTGPPHALEYDMKTVKNMAQGDAARVSFLSPSLVICMRLNSSIWARCGSQCL